MARAAGNAQILNLQAETTKGGDKKQVYHYTGFVPNRTTFFQKRLFYGDKTVSP